MTAVVRVQSDSDESNQAWEITVWRQTFGRPQPRAEDVPPDVRVALRAWLDQVESP